MANESKRNYKRRKKMRTIGIVMMALLTALLFFNPSAPADQKQVSITWTYENAPSDLAGFHLYLNGTQVQDLNVPTATSWTGTVDLVDGANTIELAPYDTAGQEGPKSDPYQLNYDAPPQTAPVITDAHIVE